MSKSSAFGVAAAIISAFMLWASIPSSGYGGPGSAENPPWIMKDDADNVFRQMWSVNRILLARVETLERKAGITQPVMQHNPLLDLLKREYKIDGK